MASFKEDFKDTAVAVLETAQDQYRDAIVSLKKPGLCYSFCLLF
jgi:hypothetical protein